MPPKRQGKKGGKAPASKGTKSRESSEEVESARTQVNWAVPRARRRDVPDQAHIDNYGEALYDRPSDELQPVQPALPEAQIRSPIYQRKDGKDMQAGDANQSSTALRDLYNDIKRRSVAEQDGVHNIAALTRRFEAGGENTVVILSRAENEEVLVLNEDRRLQVTVNDLIAHIDFIRRASSNVKDRTLGYFIRLPQDISVTVNGTTYTNDDTSSPEPFFIGPLRDYAVIELLSQPAFFFRHSRSLKYRVNTRRATQEEMERRDRNGDTNADNVTVRWLQIEALEDGEEESVQGEDVTQAEEEPFEDDGDVPAEEQPAEEQPAEEQPAEKQHPEKDTPMEECHPKEDLPIESNESEGHEPTEDEYSDTFTDEGKPITDPCGYIRNGLKLHLNDRLASLIPRVIAAVNHRQPETAGFSFVHNDTIFRPGRTLLTALSDGGRHLLLVGPMQPDRSIRLRVLYARTWRSRMHHRRRVDTDTRNWLMRTDWWHNAFDSHEEMVAHLPAGIEWVPCAQTTTREGTFTYTVLNAWALAMGLEPDPAFTPARHGNETFFVQAEQIFDLALRDSLTWQRLLAFFRCTGFVKPATTVEGEDSEEASLPPRNRRFDQRRRPFESLIADQANADEVFPRKNLRTEYLPVQLEDGILHSRPFASDSFADDEQNILIQLVRQGRWRLRDTADQLRQRFAQLADESGHSSQTNLPLADSLVQAPQPDALAVPVNFDPCRHLAEFIHMEELFHRCANENPLGTTGGKDAPKIPRLARQDIQGSLAAVIRAVNQHHPPGAGFFTEPLEATVKSSLNGSQESIAIFMVEASDNHEVCVLVQYATDGGHSCIVIDSAPRATRYDVRTAITNRLHRDIPFKWPIQWLIGPQQAAGHHSGYHVVLNAWSIVLGLRLNHKFTSEPQFLRDAYYVIQAALQGEADWLLIWALLRCHGYVTSTEAPAAGRRFARTIPLSGHDAYMRERMSKEGEAATGARVNVYEHFQADSFVKYDEDSNWDELYPEHDDGITGIRELQPGEDGNSTPVPEETQQDHPQPADDFKPCEYLRATLQALLSDEEIRQDLNTFRAAHVTTKRGEWLLDGEVALAIGAVLIAINAMQGIQEGFSIIPQVNVEIAAHDSQDIFATSVHDAVRPGRPLLMPCTYRDHTVLFVAQFDEQGRPTIFVLDSKPYHYSPRNRERLFQQVWRALQRSSWWRGFFTDLADFDNAKPASANWVDIALQPSSSECGYLTMLNAWGLALGLQPTRNVKLICNEQFFTELDDVMHLARLGHADWRLIFAFLRCHNIVQNGVIPENRRFANTFRIQREGEFDKELEELRQIERLYWGEHTYDSDVLRWMRDCNRIPNLGGRLHNADTAFPSDKWNDRTKKDYAPRLLRFQKLDINCNDAEIRAAYKTLMKDRIKKCQEELGAAALSSKESAQEGLLRYIRSEIDLHYQNMGANIQKDFRGLLEDSLEFYKDLWKDPEIRQALASTEAVPSDNWRRMLDDSEINLALASVLEAVNALQMEIHTEANPQALFAGGFSISTTPSLNMSLIPDEATRDLVILHPRRAWLFPVVTHEKAVLAHLEAWAAQNGVPKKSLPLKGNHTFLVLVQEVADSKAANPGGTSFEIQIFDSSPGTFNGIWDFFRERIQDAARRIGWATHRSEFGAPRFRDEFRVRQSVPHQARGGFACGHHTLINAWLIAMGLHHNPKAKLEDNIYRELVSLSRAAIAGILDWKTLVSWLFRHHLTVEREFDAVPENRRFSFTTRQINEAALRERILENSINDQILATQDPAVAPYDHSNNYVDRVPKSSGNASKSHGLKRQVDDADLSFLGCSRGIKRKRREGLDNSLDFLDRYHIRFEDGNKVPARCSSAWKRRRISDSLSFLDAY